VRFYLGTHMTNWLPTFGERLFVSHRRLAKRKELPRAAVPWALDSGGFTELNLHGRWQTTPHEYVAAVRRYRDEVGLLEWAAPQDWMCEPIVRERTGYTVADHQRLTVHNLLDLRDLAPELPIVPVLQGWHRDDYLRHVDQYAAAGIDVTAEPLVGLGTVCRRQDTTEGYAIVSALASAGINLHGFGVKLTGLARYGQLLASADSLAWSYNARRNPPLPECRHDHCASCPLWAAQWRAKVMRILAEDRPVQLMLS
jgi:hypothetical protein